MSYTLNTNTKKNVGAELFVGIIGTLNYIGLCNYTHELSS
jgi:hypothetical protein